MNTQLTSDIFHFSLNTDGFSWNLKPVNQPGFELKSVRMQVDYLVKGILKQTGLYWRSTQIQRQQCVASALGDLEWVDIFPSPDAHGLQFRLSFAVSDPLELFLWKITIHNRGNLPVQIMRITLLDLGEPEETLAGLVDPAFFSNGWGSWNHTGAFGRRERFRRTSLSFFSNPMRINPGTPQPKQTGVFASDMFGVVGDRQSRKGLLAGFLSQERHFGSLEVDFLSSSFNLWANGDAAQLDPGADMETDWACIQFVDIDAADPLSAYIKAVARQAGIDSQRFQKPVSAGWCSWYHFYTQVQQQDILSNLEAIQQLKDSLPLSFVQIDDGFETRVGDWFDFTPGFPDGVSPLAQEIRTAGFTPGLWLAPFIVDRRSRLAQAHPDWLLRGRFNLPVNAGFLWNRFATALDLTIPEALAYACQVVKTAAHEWNFPYLKLDFLYAGALPGKRSNPYLTRAQILRTALQALRTTAGEQTFLLGCGCPLGSGVGLVDAMRIGADVDGRWKPAILGKDIPSFHHEPDLPSARNAIQNTLTRAAFHRRWWLNDPDCLLLRETTQLTLDEIQSLATVIALSGGLWVLSDHLPELSPERLQIAQALLPTIGQRPEILDWFDASMPGRVRLNLSSSVGTWQLLALFNWQEQLQTMDFRLQDYGIQTGGAYWLRNFWQNETLRLVGDESIPLTIPAHAVRLFAVRAADQQAPVYLGSNLHISQGLELKQKHWNPSERTLELNLERPGQAAGIIELSLPSAPQTASLDGQKIEGVSTPAGNYQFSLEFIRQTHLHIQCAKN